MATNNSRKRLLALRKILEQRTDKNHGLSIDDLIEALSQFEPSIHADRKAIYRDIDELIDSGFAIDKPKYANLWQYRYTGRVFANEDLMLMVDAVRSCRAIDQERCERIIGNIVKLADEYGETEIARKARRRKIDIVRRISASEEASASPTGELDKLDIIEEALPSESHAYGKKISFKQHYRTTEGKVKPEGKEFIVTPLRITYDSGFYYLTAWDENFDKSSGRNNPRIDRVDRMYEITTLDEEGNPNAYSKWGMSKDDSAIFGQFDGKELLVTLVDNEKNTEIIFDRFGPTKPRTKLPNGDTPDGDKVVITVKVKESPQFYGWVASMGGVVTIAPDPKHPEAFDNYKKFLKGLLEGIGESVL